MIDREISKTMGALGRATGHYAWQWDGHNAFTTAGLSDDIASVIIGDIEALDGRISRTKLATGTNLSIGYDDAVHYIEAEARDRSHVQPAPFDNLLGYLQANHSAFIWQPRDGGYVGHGYDLSKEAELKKPFLKAGIRPEATQVETNHEGPTHALFISDNAVRELVQATTERTR